MSACTRVHCLANCPASGCAATDLPLLPALYLQEKNFPSKFSSITGQLPPYMKELNSLTSIFIQSTNQNPIPESFNFFSSTPFPSLLCEVSCCKEDIFIIGSSLDTSKAVSIDNIDHKLLKFCAISLYKPITQLLQKSIHLNQIPQEWSIHLISPILKSSGPSNITNYRPIILLCTISKILKKVLLDVIYIHVIPITNLN